MSYSARHKRITQDRHAGKHSHGGRRHSWTGQRKDRAETEPAEMPADQEAQSGQGLGAPGGE